MILYPRTTTGDLVDALIPTNTGISNMGGPAGNTIPDHDCVNAALNLPSHWTTHSHNRKSHARLCACDSFNAQTHVKTLNAGINMHANSDWTHWHCAFYTSHQRQKHTTHWLFVSSLWQASVVGFLCVCFKFLGNSCSLFATFYQSYKIMSSCSHSSFFYYTLNQTCVLISETSDHCHLFFQAKLLTAACKTQPVCIPVSWLDLRTLPFD